MKFRSAERKALFARVAAGLGLGFLYYFANWNYLTVLLGEHQSLFFQPALSIGYVAALWTATFLVAALSLGLCSLIRRPALPAWLREGARFGWLGLVFLALRPLRNHLGLNPPKGLRAWVRGALHSAPLVTVVAVALFGFLGWRYRRQLSAVLERGFQLASPICLYCVYITFMTLRWDVTSSEARRAPQMQAAPKTTPRVIVYIFDEWSYVETYPKEGEPKYPELAAIRDRFLSATYASSPHHDTEQSIPAYLTGERVRWTAPESPTDLRVMFFGASDSRLLSEGPTIFHEARNAGYKIALSGYYLPYCRVFGPLLSSCQAVRGNTFLPQLGFRKSLETLTNVFRTPLSPLARYEHELQRREAVLRLADPSNSFVWFHWSVPHFPTVDDIEGPDGYVPNLRYVAQAVGELREQEKAPWWDESLVVVTSDHSWRYWDPVDPRIPFFVKFPGQKKGVRYDRAFNTIVLHRLLRAAIDGQLPYGTDPAQWLDDNAKDDVRTYPRFVPGTLTLTDFQRQKLLLRKARRCTYTARRRRCQPEKEEACRISDEPTYCDGLSFGYL